MRSVGELEERLSRPRAELVADLAAIGGDIVVLGAAGKLGPSLVRMAVRGSAAAGTGSKVTAVSRFSAAGLAESLADDGAQIVEADIADDEALAKLPDAANVIFLVGAKFGTSGRESATWATNTYLAGRVASRYRETRLVALSTGNVYPLMPVGAGGATEQTRPDPVGEYAMSCLGRERLFTHFSERFGTQMVLLRLNYAVEPRYGVLTDIAQAVLAGTPIELTMGHVNVVWQGYANEVILRSLRLAATPPAVLNLTGPELVSTRHLATLFGVALGREPTFSGAEADTALLSNAGRCHRLFGYPDVPLELLVEWVAAWTEAGLPTYHKPTHYQQRNGQF